ncbi:MAG: nicotinamide-nucleotide adenylyltransferase [Candidatus Woesearchaeota archaeon]|nr:nicotinamide-nucleotide adenylyltransferase [Candidatus Woesearchaeota archaeon]
MLCTRELAGGPFPQYSHTVFLCSQCQIIYDATMEGLYIGRFQPFHNGHLALIKEMLKEVKTLHIVVGSAQHIGTKENPFSADERREMIRAALTEAGIKNVDITPVPDIIWHSKYVEHIKTFVPHFDIVYVAENKHLEELFSAAGCKIKTHHRIDSIMGTEIRNRMAKKEPWEHLVPPAVANYLKKIGGQERVRKLLAE